MFDYLVIGAGFAGCVLAERLAGGLGKSVLIVDKRPHIGGNAYDEHDDHGVLIHKYGPHIFHTNSREVFTYLSRFTDWYPYQHRVRAWVDGRLVPIPINLDTINELYGADFNAFQLGDFYKSVAEPRAELKTSEDVILNQVGRELYEKFFRNYTRKQWGLDPSELDASVTARVPTRTNRDDRYFTDAYQAMPLRGFTRMFQRMVDHPRIKILLNTDYHEIEGSVLYDEVIATGPIDEYFDYRFGKLPYRSLQFQWETLDTPVAQPVAVVNYPNDNLYTRITEFKYLTGQQHPKTTRVYEYPQAEGAPYYPIPRAENAALYKQYQELAAVTPGVQFVGRLGTYKYYNMDQVVAQALSTFAKIAGIPGLSALVPDTDMSIELWGGLECTINRVGNRFFDQLARCAHYARLDDLNAIAALGIRTLRYPALWEHIAPEGVARADWRWCDAALGRLRYLGVDPIIGLVHHGSGPRWTHLLDPGFAAGLSAYAAAFAERYPWVRHYTPVNEPVTTARFAGLYGHWYPHRRDDRSFVAALLNQCCGIADAMTAIRVRVPDAQLVQTEDGGSVRATRRLAAQAAFENQRRWLSLDLLTGTVDEHHPLWRYLIANSGDRTQLARLRDEPVPPDVVGLNYYATSDRFLDDRLDRYPPSLHGGNGRQRYADADAVRVEGVGLRGHAEVLTEAWNRYRRPVAITEAHLGCTREEQMRWLAEAWLGAHHAAAQGADVRAVAAWAVLGSWDWDSLLTRGDTNHYEAGAFDVRTGSPQPTALTGIISDLAAGRELVHPVLDAPGWWRRTGPAIQAPARPMLITGANGTLGRAFVHACNSRGLRYVALARRDLDISNPEAVRGAVARWRPWAIVNAAGYVRVDEAEQEPAMCRRANAVGPAILAAVCRKAGIQLVTFSSDLVFDGQSARPYVERDPVCPLNIYGRSKVEAERRVLAFAPSALVIRTSAFFGPWDRANVISCALDALASGRTFQATSRAIVSPTYVPDLVNRALDLLIDGAAGLWHVANAGAVSWLEFARMAAVAARLNPDPIRDGHTGGSHRRAARPPYSVLSSEYGAALPPLEESLLRFVRDRAVVGSAA